MPGIKETLALLRYSSHKMMSWFVLRRTYGLWGYFRLLLGMPLAWLQTSRKFGYGL
jgi:hypothetical protein